MVVNIKRKKVKPDKRSWTDSFYNKTIPEEIKEYLPRIDFYKALGFLTIEAGKKDYPITPIIRKLYQLRFVKDMTITEILNELRMSRASYNNIMDNYSIIIKNYLVSDVVPYPVRIAILLTRSLKNKPVLKTLYHMVSGSNNCRHGKIRTHDIVNAYLVEHGYRRSNKYVGINVIMPQDTFNLTKKEIELVINLAISIHWMYIQNKEEFLRYVKFFGENKRAAISALKDFEDYHAKLNQED